MAITPDPYIISRANAVWLRDYWFPISTGPKRMKGWHKSWRKWVLEEGGINSHSPDNHTIVDERKYLLFVLKYS